MRTVKETQAELSKAAATFCSATTKQQKQAARNRINKLLDERLDQKGVHPANCRCHDCNAAVARMLMERHPDDTASPQSWGPMGCIEDAA